MDVGQDAVFFDNPDLPETRSEVALPLQARGEIIGVLDVQSIEPQAFSDEDVTALEALADQVAVAISNARLMSEAQQALEAERRAYGEIGRKALAGVAALAIGSGLSLHGTRCADRLGRNLAKRMPAKNCQWSVCLSYTWASSLAASSPRNQPMQANGRSMRSS